MLCGLPFEADCKAFFYFVTVWKGGRDYMELFDLYTKDREKTGDTIERGKNFLSIGIIWWYISVFLTAKAIC